MVGRGWTCGCVKPLLTLSANGKKRLSVNNHNVTGVLVLVFGMVEVDMTGYVQTKKKGYC